MPSLSKLATSLDTSCVTTITFPRENVHPGSAAGSALSPPTVTKTIRSRSLLIKRAVNKVATTVCLRVLALARQVWHGLMVIKTWKNFKANKSPCECATFTYSRCHFHHVVRIYTWSPRCPNNAKRLHIECVPMLWGRKQQKEFKRLVKRGYSNTVLGFNECVRNNFLGYVLDTFQTKPTGPV